MAARHSAGRNLQPASGACSSHATTSTLWSASGSRAARISITSRPVAGAAAELATDCCGCDQASAAGPNEHEAWVKRIQRPARAGHHLRPTACAGRSGCAGRAIAGHQLDLRTRRRRSSIRRGADGHMSVLRQMNDGMSYFMRHHMHPARSPRACLPVRHEPSSSYRLCRPQTLPCR